MTASDQELQRLREAHAREGTRAAGEVCPDPEHLWSGARGELPPDQARLLVGHTAKCAECAEAWRLAREMSPLAPPSGIASVPELPGSPFVRWRPAWAALAAGLGAVVLLATLLRMGGGPGAPAYRSGTAGTVRSLLPEGQALPRARLELSWSAAPEGSRYDIRVANERLATIALARGLEHPRYVVPADKLAGLTSGMRLLWQVEVVLPDGARQTSPTFVTLLQ